MNDEDYERIKTIIGDIYEEHSDIMSCIPIDIFEVAHKMGFRIILATERIIISNEKLIEFQEINRKKDVFGFSFFDHDREEYVIYIDNVNAGDKKQRFSVAHEIGHIALGHIDMGVENEDKAEKEADYFAGYILCPDCIGLNEKILYEIYQDKTILVDIFGISLETAMIKYKFIFNRNRVPFDYYEYEKIIMGCLEKPILNCFR